MKILLTGADGQLGRAIQNEYGDSADFVLTGLSANGNIKSLDISDLDAVMEAVSGEHPDMIINCAAYTNVDGCETNTEEAYKANAIGPRNLAIASNETGIRLIHVSTDYVFPGNGNVPYTEFDPVGPKSAYGRSKLAGEEFVQNLTSRYFILRTAWLYGDGKNFVKTMVNASKTRDEVSVVMDQRGTPTTTMELARMIHYLSGSQEYGLYHATCEGDSNWADFTQEIYSQLGISTRVNKVTSEEYKAMNPKSADRPKFSILDNSMLRLTGASFSMKDWKDALIEYLGTGLLEK